MSLPSLHFQLCRAPNADPLLPGDHSGGMQTEPFDVTLEQALSNLERLPGMFVELDGSFVWAIRPSTGGTPTGQMDGTIYDRPVTTNASNVHDSVSTRVQWLDVRGQFPLTALDELVASLETPAHQLMAVMLPEQTIKTYEDLRRLCD